MAGRESSRRLVSGVGRVGRARDYSINLFSRIGNDWGSASSSDLAGFMFTTTSNLMGWSTGGPAGFVHLKIRPTYLLRLGSGRRRHTDDRAFPLRMPASEILATRICATSRANEIVVIRLETTKSGRRREVPMRQAVSIGRLQALILIVLGILVLQRQGV